MFHSNIINIYGQKGKDWLDTLPQLVVAISSRLGLRDLQEITNLTYNYVLSGFQGGKPIILKLGLNREGLTREAFALKCFAGCGAVKLLAEDDGVLLLEKAVPGTSLKGFFPDKEQKSIEIACGVMQKLHQATIPAAYNSPQIKDWLTALDNDWSIPHEYLQKARKLARKLFKTTGLNVLLHGDLHHDNILQNGDAWVVIDPKGVIGSPMNEIWPFVMDIERDIPFIAQYFGFKIQDLFDWYFVHLILAICWNLEDNIEPHLFLTLAAKAYQYVS